MKVFFNSFRFFFLVCFPSQYFPKIVMEDGGVGWELALISSSCLTSFSDKVGLKIKAVLPG